MVFKKKAKRGGGSKKMPLALIGAMGISGYVNVVRPAMGGNYEGALANLTGYDTRVQKFQPERLVYTYGPVLGGVLLHKAASKLGVNRAIPKWIPFSI